MDLTSPLDHIIKHLDQEFATLQLGRASTGLVESVEVFIPSRGMKQKLSQTANISIIDAQTLKIEPRDKSIIASIEKGIYDANIGLTPVNMGDHLMIKIPALTTERRKELVKFVSKIGEDSKIALRNTRHDAMKDIKNQYEAKTISEDEKKSQEKYIDEMIKEYTQKIEIRVKNKSEEVMNI